MKTSFCTIAFRHKKISLEDMIFIISKLGYDGIEIWGKHLIGSETSLKDLSNFIAARKLNVSMISPYFNFTDSQKKWIRSIEEAQKNLAFAVELNCPLIRCFTGEVGSKWATKKQWENAVLGIREIANSAQKDGITIAIETHCDTLADTTTSCIKLLEAVNMKNVGLILDFYNLWEVEPQNPLEILDILYPYSVHIHAKNAILSRGKVSPFRYVMDETRVLDSIRLLGNGDLEYTEILRELIKRDYNGYFSIECFETERNILWVAEEELRYIHHTMENQEYSQIAGF